MNQARILITGLNGTYGWNIYRQVAKHHITFGTYRKSCPALQKGHNFFRVNWDDEAEVNAFFQKIRPEYIIHAWSMCDMDVCEISPDIAHKVNIEGRGGLSVQRRICRGSKNS